MKQPLALALACTGLIALTVFMGVFFAAAPVLDSSRVPNTAQLDKPVGALSSDCLTVARGKENVTWNPGWLSATLQAGESAEMTMKLNAPNGLGPTTINVAPALAPYVHISPTKIPCLVPGATQDLTLVFSAPVNAPSIVVSAAIQLLASDGGVMNKANIASSLPIEISIVRHKDNSAWSKVKVAEGVIATFPPTLISTSQPDYQSVILEATTADPDRPNPIIGIHIDPNPSNFSFEEYYGSQGPRNLIDDLLPDTFTSITVQGKSAYRVQSTDGFMMVVIPISGSFVVVTDAGLAFQQTGEFNQVLNGLDLGVTSE